jgi:hypothetical protein
VQAIEPFGEKGVQPSVHRVGVSGAQEASAGHGVGRSAVGDPEQSGGAFADKGLGMVVAVVVQQLALLIGKGRAYAR